MLLFPTDAFPKLSVSYIVLHPGRLSDGVEWHHLSIQHTRETLPRQIRYHRPGRPFADTSECQCGEQREKENGQDQPEGGLNAVRAEKERRPGEIEGQLYGEERERRRTPIRTARGEDHRQCEAHQRSAARRVGKEFVSPRISRGGP